MVFVLKTSYTFTAKTAKLSFNAQTVQNLHYSYRYTVFYLLCRRRIFLSISKGIVVCRSHIVNISNDGVYTMSDGRTFQGRKRDMSSHRRLRAEIELTNTKHRPLSMLEKCSLLDNMPLAFCVIELVFNEDGCGVDFIFRYCNAEMATVEGVPVEEMLNRSFYRVFPNGDKKWLVSYADVALNGTKHTLHDYSPEIDKNLIIHCYQPEPGYCACVLQVTDQ